MTDSHEIYTKEAEVRAAFGADEAAGLAYVRRCVDFVQELAYAPRRGPSTWAAAPRGARSH